MMGGNSNQSRQGTWWCIEGNEEKPAIVWKGSIQEYSEDVLDKWTKEK